MREFHTIQSDMRSTHSRVAFRALDNLIDRHYIHSMQKDTMTKTELLTKREAYVKHMQEHMKSTSFMAPLTVAFSRDMITTIDKQLAALEG